MNIKTKIIIFTLLLLSSVSLGAYVRQVITIPGPISRDAFGRQRTSTPYTLFESMFLNSNRAPIWDEELFAGGTATFSGTEARVQLSTTASGDAVIRQTFERFSYQPGKSQQAFFTFVSPLQTNVRKRIGLFEGSNVANSVPQNGIFLEQDGSTVSLCIAKNGTITEEIAQGSWNEDTLDGTGPSTETLDFNDSQIMMIDFQWLGVGTVRIWFESNNELVLAHSFSHANANSGVYMSTPNLPCNYSIYQSGAGTGTLDQICSSVSSEGGLEPSGLTYSYPTTPTSITVSTAWEALFAIRLKSGYEDIGIDLNSISANITSVNDDATIGIWLNPTVGGSPTYVNYSESCQTYTGNGSTNTLSGGTLLWSGQITTGATLSLNTFLLPRIGKAIDGTMDTLVIGAYAPASTDITASMNWQER